MEYALVPVAWKRPRAPPSEDPEEELLVLHKRAGRLTLGDCTYASKAQQDSQAPSSSSRRRPAEGFDDDDYSSPIGSRKAPKTTALTPLLPPLPAPLKDLDAASGEETDKTATATALDFFFHSGGRVKYSRRVDLLVDELLSREALSAQRRRLGEPSDPSPSPSPLDICFNNSSSGSSGCVGGSGLPEYWPRGSHPLQDRPLFRAARGPASSHSSGSHNSSSGSRSSTGSGSGRSRNNAGGCGDSDDEEDEEDEDDGDGDGEGDGERGRSEGLGMSQGQGQSQGEQQGEARQPQLAQALTHQDWGMVELSPAEQGLALALGQGQGQGRGGGSIASGAAATAGLGTDAGSGAGSGAGSASFSEMVID